LGELHADDEEQRDEFRDVQHGCVAGWPLAVRSLFKCLLTSQRIGSTGSFGRGRSDPAPPMAVRGRPCGHTSSV
jgi:hypothetical protein